MKKYIFLCVAVSMSANSLHAGCETASLGESILNDCATRLEELLSTGTNPNKTLRSIEQMGDDISPIALAAKRGSLDLVRILLKHGANVEGGGYGDCTSSGGGYSQCIWLGKAVEIAASRRRQLDLVQLLIANGAKPQNAFCGTTYIPAKNPAPTLEIIKYSISQGATPEPCLNDAVARDGELETMDYLVSLGVFKDAFPKAAARAIHADATNSEKTIEYLLNTGLDPNSVYENQSLLSVAVRYNRISIVETLLNKGADLARAENKTILFKDGLDLKLIQLLVNHGTSLKQLDSSGRNLLHLCQTPDVVTYLFDAGLDAKQNAVASKAEFSPLSSFLAHCTDMEKSIRLQTLQLLLDHNDINDPKTLPLWSALVNDSKDLAFLAENGANPNLLFSVPQYFGIQTEEKISFLHVMAFPNLQHPIRSYLNPVSSDWKAVWIKRLKKIGADVTLKTEKSKKTPEKLIKKQIKDERDRTYLLEALNS